MFTVLDCVVQEHDYRFVLLAVLVCLLGNIGLFVLLKRSIYCVQTRGDNWLSVAAVAAGVTIWATHFIGMLAYNGVAPISFDAGLTTLSVVIAIAFNWAVFRWVRGEARVGRSLLAGVGAAAGVATMHFIGIASIVGPVKLSFEALPIIIAFGVSTLLFAVAIHVFSKISGWRKFVLPSLPSVLSILLLHFTAMSATTISVDPTASLELAGDVSRQWLVPAVVAATLVLVALAVAGAFVDRWLTDAIGLADATLEGIAIISEGKIIEVNKRLSVLVGVSSGALIGSSPTDWLVADGAADFALDEGQSVEARLRGSADEDQIFEVTSHVIEYRGRSCQVLAVRDLSDRKRAQRAIEHMASHDPLTDLANRSYFVNALDTAIAADEPFALLALDLDRFKAINDLFGHSAGDEVLRHVASVLRNSVRGDDTVARIGGDEFLIIQRGVDTVDAARQLANRILTTLNAGRDAAIDPMAVGVSIGVAFYPQDGRDAETLQQNADTALYRAKNIGWGNAAFFDQEMDEVARERRLLEHDLRQAIARGQLRLVYQPLVATTFGSVIGYEALLRWDHPERGEVPPDFFIPIAEEIGAILGIGEWVLREACATAATWPSNVSVAVNVSTVQFQVSNLPQLVRDALQGSGLEGHRLELEITESAFMRNRQATLKALHEVRAMGVRIAMDDFGTGYSSLSNLKAFPFDKIKIDKSFVSMPDDAAARSIVRAIVALGRSFGTPIVAEGVETEAQHQMLLDEGCSQAQGFYFGAPAVNPYQDAEADRATSNG